MKPHGFLKHFFFWLVLPLLLTPIIFPAVASFYDHPEWIQLSEDEQAMNMKVYGAEQENTAYLASLEIFRNSIYPRVQHIVNARGGGTPLDTVFDRFTQNFSKHFWVNAYRIVYRWQIIKLWLFGALLILAASAVDGMVVRYIRSRNATPPNNRIFYLSSHAVIFCIGASIISLCAPGYLIWLTPLLIGGVVPLLIWVSLVNYQAALQ